MFKALVGFVSLFLVSPVFGHTAYQLAFPSEHLVPVVGDVEGGIAPNADPGQSASLSISVAEPSGSESFSSSAHGRLNLEMEPLAASTLVRAPEPERFHWRAALLESLLFLSYQQGGNIALSPWIRRSLAHPNWKDPHGTWFSNWESSLEGYRWTVWNDNDPFLDDYIAHPMMGAISGYVQIQNDPAGRSLEIENSRRYWKSRGKALAWSAVYSAQWKLGPLSETSIGNIGEATYYSTASHGISNGTGMVDLVMTPVGGAAWGIGEDLIDKYIIQRLEHVSHRKVWLLAISMLNPCRSGANLLRFRAPYYRDGRRSGTLVGY